MEVMLCNFDSKSNIIRIHPFYHAYYNMYLNTSLLALYWYDRGFNIVFIAVFFSFCAQTSFSILFFRYCSVNSFHIFVLLYNEALQIFTNTFFFINMYVYLCSRFLNVSLLNDRVRFAFQ